MTAGSLNLIDAFNAYLVPAFVVGTVLRARNYRKVLGLVSQSEDRWPRLRTLAAGHGAVFLRWPVVLPAPATLLLTLGSAGASLFVWSYARVTAGDLWSHPAGLAAVAAVGAAMGFLDFKAVFRFARFDRAALEAVLDRTEHWLGSWQAPAVRVLTAGLVHPRRIVGEQVRRALVDASLAVNGRARAVPFRSACGSRSDSPCGPPGRPPCGRRVT